MPVIFMERSLLDSLTEADIKEIIDENEGHTKYARLEGYPGLQPQFLQGGDAPDPLARSAGRWWAFAITNITVA